MFFIIIKILVESSERPVLDCKILMINNVNKYGWYVMNNINLTRKLYVICSSANVIEVGLFSYNFSAFVLF